MASKLGGRALPDRHWHERTGSASNATTGPTVTFRVTSKSMNANERLYMLGDGNELGDWDPGKAKPLSCQDGGTWTIRFPLQRPMSMTYKFVCISKDPGGFGYIRWENGDNRVFKRNSEGIPTSCSEEKETRAFGERKPLTDTSLDEDMDDFESVGQSDGSLQEIEATSASDPAGVQQRPCEEAWLDWANREMTQKLQGFQDDLETRWFKLFENQERLWLQAMESAEVNGACRTDAADGKPLAVEWLRDGAHSKIEQSLSALGERLQKIEADTDAMVKLEVETKILASKIDATKARIEQIDEGLWSRMEQCLRDSALSKKQRDLEFGMVGVQEKMKDSETSVSALTRKFQKLEADTALQADSMAAFQSKIDVATKERIEQIEEGLQPKMEQCLRDSALSKKQQNLEAYMVGVQEKMKDSETSVSALTRKFQKLEADTALQADSMAAFHSKIDVATKERIEQIEEGLQPKMEQCLRDSALSKKQRDLEFGMVGVQEKMKDSETSVSALTRKFQKLEADTALQADSMAAFQSKIDVATNERIEQIEEGLQPKMEQCLRDSALSKKQRDLEFGMVGVQEKMKDTMFLISSSSRKFEELESVVASQKTLLASQSKSFEVMQREINDLEIHIPRKPAPQKIESSQSLERLQDLESQIVSLGQALQRMSEKETQPPLVEPHAAKVEMPQPAAPATSINNGALNEWNEVSWKPAAEASSSDVASRRRSSSMPKYTAPKPKRGFEFQRPLKPTDTSMRDVCLEVERQLCEAMFGEAPVDVRKKVLKTVQLRCHPDKLGDRSGRDVEALNWLEDWKSTHIKLYFQPHDVPEEYQKYLRS